MIRLGKLASAVTGLFAVGITLLTTGCGSSNTTVRLMNAFVGLSSVDLLLANKSVITGVTYGGASGYTAASSDSSSLQIAATGNPNALLNQSISLQSGAFSTVLATSSGAIVLSDDHTAPASGTIEIRVINASPTLGTADVYIVAPGTDISTVSPVVSSLTYQSASGYIPMNAGSYEVIFTQAGQKFAFIDSNSLSFSAGQIRTIVGLNGQNGGFTTSVLSDLN